MSGLTHLDESGSARMVDVGHKAETARSATATGRITMNAAALAAIRDDAVPKGDVLAAARIAGIMAAKRTGTLIPLCHPLSLDSVSVDCTVEDDGVRVTATASLTGKTGVEMEAMVACNIALLTIYDMAKALDKGMVIQEVRLLSKTGGKSGDWRADEAQG
ncbi:MAG: cyclic pyranopterin monophosphate synthase MoaC [Citromicrobium sp.]|nr:cyclic pyranopterin monophosphate synthase MoaC [Citromicrobium sp.]MAO96635.1 cyclic pyranopterin monophosphate synthase MoaC [Citromicrobium sp.]MAS85276.1 cyclic pyranopterin monophosphate synthase MoaC [Erythrobacteraceae bacterium]MBD75487.1 cyclic pyranopterin monophosphate synthase MoaC [Citromicrobium sp.]MBT47154.1 cyclic pyranopterin monophosphate synthase MoaC [Citromicrobium sp.]